MWRNMVSEENDQSSVNDLIKPIGQKGKKVSSGLFSIICITILIIASFTVAVSELYPVYAAPGDQDDDGILDVDEVNGFFFIEKLETEDAFAWNNANFFQFYSEIKGVQGNVGWLSINIFDNADFINSNRLGPGDLQIEIIGWGKIVLRGYPPLILKQIEDNEQILLNSIAVELVDGFAVYDHTSIVSETREFLPGSTSYESEKLIVFQQWYVCLDFASVSAESLTFMIDPKPWLGFYQIAHPQLVVDEIQLLTSEIRINQKGLNPGCDDTDGDTVKDGDEVLKGSSPFKPDVDRDGLDDRYEIDEGFLPYQRDSDFDGLRDRVELGNLSFGDSDLTEFDENPSQGSLFEKDCRAQIGPLPPYMIDNYVSGTAPMRTTSPIDHDDDDDGLPDGCIDGWKYSAENFSWFRSDDLNNIADFWEGEDLDLDGETDGGGWNLGIGPGETDCENMDSDFDDMPDGWEVWHTIDPLDDGSQDVDMGAEGDVDETSYLFEYSHPDDYQLGQSWVGDGLENLDEYIAGTNPRMNDTDGDWVYDVDEVLHIVNGQPRGVIFRTNVPMGGRSAENYGSIAALGDYEWVWYLGTEYSYQGISTQTMSSSDHIIWGRGLEDKEYINFFDETSWVLWKDMNQEWEIHVIRPKPLATGEIVQECIRYVYDSTEQSTAPTDTAPVLDYRHQEVYWTNPLSPTTDGIFWGNRVQFEDSIRDYNDHYDEDTDGDGLSDARDIDSDGDTIQDVIEGWGDEDGDIDNDGAINMHDTDADGDGVSDETEIYQRELQEEYSHYQNFEYFTDPFDADSDGDGLLDGSSITLWDSDPLYSYLSLKETPIANVTNEGDGTVTFFGENEYGTLRYDPDTDDDLLYDGHTIIGIDGREHVGEKDVGTDPTIQDCDYDTIPDGHEYLGWSYTIYEPGGRPIRCVGTSDPLSNPTGSNADSDLDGIPDRYEYKYTDGNNDDTDGDGIKDGKEDKNYDRILDIGETHPLLMDTDGDGLVDGYYDINKNSVADSWEGEDLDCDGYLEPGETNPRVEDTDGDGASDGIERRIVMMRTSSYGDDYSVGDWIALYIEKVDSGEVYRSDGLVYFYTAGTNDFLHDNLPSDASNDFYKHPRSIDDPFGNEIYVNKKGAYSTNGALVFIKSSTTNKYMKFISQVFSIPTTGKVSVLPIWDYRARETLYTNLADPRDMDSDTPDTNNPPVTLNDGDELLMMCQVLKYGPKLIDVDNDGSPSPYDPDSDGDTIEDHQDPIGTVNWYRDLDKDGLPCALDRDSDGDGMDDNDPDEDYPLCDDTKDDDGDGIINGDENDHGMDKDSVDSDKDGIDDGKEVEWYLDLDGDGIDNGADPDSDGDGLLDGPDKNIICIRDPTAIPPEWDTTELDYFTNNGIISVYLGLDADNNKEYKLFGEDQDADLTTLLATETDPYDYDTDNDGLPDGKGMTIDGVFYPGEREIGTLVRDKDTDDDGLVDGGEVVHYFNYDRFYPDLQINNDLDYSDMMESQKMTLIHKTSSDSFVYFFIEEAGNYVVTIIVAAGGTDAKPNIEFCKAPYANTIDTFSKQIFRFKPVGQRPFMENAPYREIAGYTWNGIQFYGYAYEVTFEFTKNSAEPEEFYLRLNEATVCSNTNTYLILGYVYIKKQGLDPLNADTDGDGRSDSSEFWSERSGAISYPGVIDSDRDGLTDFQENPYDPEGKKVPTDPIKYDSDGDGISDGLDMQRLDRFDLRWMKSYSPGLLRQDQEINLYWAYNNFGGWDSNHTDGHFYEETNNRLLSSGYYLIGDLEPDGIYSDENWEDTEKREIEDYKYPMGVPKVWYKLFNDTRQANYWNVETVPGRYYRAGFDVSAIKGYDQDVIFQFSILNSQDLSVSNEDYRISFRYSVWPEVSYQSYVGYYYFGEDELFSKGETSTLIDSCSMRSNRNAYEARFFIPSEKANPKNTAYGDTGILHLDVTIYWSKVTDDTNYQDTDCFSLLDIEQTDLKVGAILTEMTDIYTSAVADPTDPTLDHDMMQKVLDQSDLREMSGPEIWTDTDTSTDYKVTYLNDLDEIVDFVLQDAGNMKWRMDSSDDQEDLDFMVIISNSQKSFYDLSAKISYTSEWSPQWGPPGTIPNNYNDKEPDAWDYVDNVLKVGKDLSAYLPDTTQTHRRVVNTDTQIEYVESYWTSYYDNGNYMADAYGMSMNLQDPKREIVWSLHDEGNYHANVYAHRVDGVGYDLAALEVATGNPDLKRSHHLRYTRTHLVTTIDEIEFQTGRDWSQVQNYIGGAQDILSIVKESHAIYLAIKNNEDLSNTEIAAFVYKTGGNVCTLVSMIVDTDSVCPTVSKLMKGAGKLINKATAIYNMAKQGIEIAKAVIDDDMIKLGLLMDQILITSIDFAISCIPIIGWIYTAINTIVAFATDYIAKHTEWLDEGFSITEAIVNWAPSPYISMKVKLQSLDKVNKRLTEMAVDNQEDTGRLSVVIYPWFRKDDGGKEYGDYIIGLITG